LLLPTHIPRRLKNGWKNLACGSYPKPNIEDKTSERGIRLHCWTISNFLGGFAYWKRKWSLLRFTQLSKGHWIHVPKIKSHIDRNTRRFELCSRALKSPYKTIQVHVQFLEHNVQVSVLSKTLSILFSNYCFNWRLGGILRAIYEKNCKNFIQLWLRPLTCMQTCMKHEGQLSIGLSI
jgi:hypothetical protein